MQLRSVGGYIALAWRPLLLDENVCNYAADTRHGNEELQRWLLEGQIVLPPYTSSSFPSEPSPPIRARRCPFTLAASPKLNIDTNTDYYLVGNTETQT